jgi:hypothetical protein
MEVSLLMSNLCYPPLTAGLGRVRRKVDGDRPTQSSTRCVASGLASMLLAKTLRSTTFKLALISIAAFWRGGNRAIWLPLLVDDDFRHESI